ncbi:MAG: hypothetical protein QG597_2785, partial [Actinomycetota bacterium]|nr:hypothetical protein [Actinomycetota bacterium]
MAAGRRGWPAAWVAGGVAAWVAGGVGGGVGEGAGAWVAGGVGGGVGGGQSTAGCSVFRIPDRSRRVRVSSAVCPTNVGRVVLFRRTLEVSLERKFERRVGSVSFGSFGVSPWGVNGMERSSSSSSSSSGGPLRVEVWRDFRVWPVTEGSPAGVLDRAAALGVAVELAAVGDADQVSSVREADAPDAEAATQEAAEAAAQRAAADADAAAEADAEADAADAAGAEGLVVSVSEGVWESGLARVVSAWWLASCPGWVSAQWADVSLSPQVRDLMTLPPGPALLAAVAAIPTGPCRVDHGGEELPGVEPVPG